jgi:hypothetical protein
MGGFKGAIKTDEMFFLQVVLRSTYKYPNDSSKLVSVKLGKLELMGLSNH